MVHDGNKLQMNHMFSVKSTIPSVKSISVVTIRLQIIGNLIFGRNKNLKVICGFFEKHALSASLYSSVKSYIEYF